MIAAILKSKAFDFLCRHRLWLLAAAAVLCFAAVAAVAISYLVYPGYLDHGEPSVALISWRILDGIPAFLGFDEPALVSNVYGPLTYGVHAVSYLFLGPSILAGKAASVLAAALIPVFVFLSQRHRGVDAAAAGAIIGAGLVLFHVPYSIWNRPDSIIALLCVIAVWSANVSDPKRPEWAKSIVIAVAAGLAVGMKIHAGAYFAPVVIYHCLNDNRGIKTFAVMSAAVLGVVMLPFAFSVFSLSNFIVWIVAHTQKDSPVTFVSKFFRHGAIYAMPVLFYLAAWRWPGKQILVAEKAYFWAFVVSLAVIMIPATKIGAGTHYFFPFLAVLVDLILRSARRVKKHEIKVWGLVGALAAIILIVGVPVQKRFFRALNWQEVAAVQTEIRAIMAAYSENTIEMGIGEDLKTYPRTFNRTLLVLDGHPYTIDYAPAMELAMWKIPLTGDLLAMLRGCNTDIWLVPKGEKPFVMTGYYGVPTIERVFPDTFNDRYVKAKSFKFFDVWMCRK